MADVSIRDLRNSGGDFIDRVEAGESFTVTRAGRPVAELRPIGRRTFVSTALLRERWARLPAMDPALLRADIDAIVDQSM